MSIKLAQESYVSGLKEVEVPNGAEKLILYVKELGYLQVQAAYVDAQRDQLDALTNLVVHSVQDKDGNKFLYEEVLSLKKEIAEPIFKAVLEVNGLDGKEKN